MYYVYEIVNLKNNKRYIGITNNVKRRFSSHLSALRYNKHVNAKLQRAFNKYGELAFEFNIIEKTLCSSEELANKETYYIKYFDSFNNGYNLSYGGEGYGKCVCSEKVKSMLRTLKCGYKESEETRKRKSISMKNCSDMKERKIRASNLFRRLWKDNAFREKMRLLNIGNTYNLGKNLSDETKEKISKSHIGNKNPFYGKHHTEEEKNHIIMDSNEVKSFLKCLGTFVETSYNVMQNIEESYRWIKKNYLSPIIKKIKHSKQKKKNTESQFATQNIPKKMVKPKKQYLIRAPDNSFKILLNMIMGIQIAVQSTPNYDINPEKEDLTKYLNKMSYSIQTTNFGLKKQETFYLREYAGIIFNNIRHTFGYDKDAFIASISPQDFVTEIMISSQTIFEELCSTGKSGSLFYYTRDGKFIVKTIGKDEYKFLKKILPEYFKHIKSNPNTLITKFLGCYQLVKKVKKRKDKFYFIIMMNIFCTSRDIQLRYDLKGSKIGRRVLKQTKEDQKILEMDNYALKDLDLDRIKQKAKIGNKKEPLMEQLRRDAEFLCRISAIDYSLLLGIHKIPNKQDFEKKETILSAKTFRLEDIKIKNKRNSEIPSNPNQRFESHKDDSQSENKLKKVNTVSNNFINHFNTNNNSANNPPVISKDNSENTKLNIALSVSNESNQNELELKSPIFDYEDGGIASEDQNEIYYVGIIDILTEYNCKKSTEHFFKMIYYCSQKMSCVAPPLYRDRFINYMDSVIINSSSIVDKKENKNE